MSKRRQIGYALSIAVALVAAVLADVADEPRIVVGLALLAFLSIVAMWVLSPTRRPRKS
jgi:hypothetical protein